jgi:hypothetical protein
MEWRRESWKARRHSRWILQAIFAVSFSAQPAEGGELRWHAPTRCSDREQVSFAVERALGMPLEQATPLVFDVEVEPFRGDVRARLRVVDEGVTEPALERVLVAPDCERLLEGLEASSARCCQCAPISHSKWQSTATRSSRPPVREPRDRVQHDLGQPRKPESLTPAPDLAQACRVPTSSSRASDVRDYRAPSSGSRRRMSISTVPPMTSP